MNYYELLQVTPSASAEVIKNAYKAMAKKYHPDLYQGNRAFAEEKMKLLNEAISILENDEKRREYNIENNFPDISDRSEQTDGFMKNIDDFLNYSDSPADISEISIFDSYETRGMDDTKPLFDYEEELEKARSSVRRSKPAIGKWYYIVIAGLVIANIAVVILIAANFSTTLLDSFLKKSDSEVGDAVSDEDDSDIEDYIDSQDWNNDWDDGIIAANEIVDIETTQDFVETAPTVETDPSIAETTTEKAALALPPTAATTGKKLPAATTAKPLPQKTTQAETIPEREPESETFPEYTETEETGDPIEFPYEDELTSEDYMMEEAPGMKPEDLPGAPETDTEYIDETTDGFADGFEDLPTYDLEQ